MRERIGVLTTMLLLIAAVAASAQSFDARTGHNAGFTAGISERQAAAERALDARVDGLSVHYAAATGAARGIRSLTGYLTGDRPGAHPRDVALEFARAQRDLLGLTDEDLSSWVVRDEVRSTVGGATHVYLGQTFRGIPVYKGLLHVNVNRDGRVLSVNNSFLPDLSGAADTDVPRLSADRAVAAAAEHLDLGVDTLDVSEATRVWVPVRRGVARLAWRFQTRTADGNHWYDFTVDASSGRVWTQTDWVSSDDYRVYERPVESPQHTSPAPPSDARTVATSPADPVASPGGWIDAGATVMDGNNVHACLDHDADNVCDANEPSCGAALSCDFPLDLSLDPTAGTNADAAVTNLFYWNNVVHDVQYQYGFDEASGNFQEDNFDRGGVGGDSITADAQDGAGNCNANFAAPPDGGDSRMQMFLCNVATPRHDGSFDDVVVVHEYGHGISSRQVAGPSNSSCLSNRQQAGEGWSDWFGLAYTARQGDAGTDVRGVGSWLLAFAPTETVRDLPYSTDNTVNDWTYESIRRAGVPHGVGSRWAQAIWEVYWALVDVHGFEEDISSFDIGDPATPGNKRAMFYVNEGLKNTACDPTFVDNRDGILQAAVDNFDGEDVCLLWEAFAGFGLGVDARAVASNSLHVNNGFAVPPGCAESGCLPSGASCTADSQCCSKPCKGPPGGRTCR